MKKVLIISSSPRKNGNSETLAIAFAKGAEDNHHEVELISLRNCKINYCIGCYKCSDLGHCFQKDDMNGLAEKMQAADVIVLATPVYFYSMSGQLKVFIDRMVQNYPKVHADIYLLVTAWDSNVANLQSTLEALRGFTRDCLENSPEKGYILAAGNNEIGDIEKTNYLQEAYKLGKNC